MKHKPKFSLIFLTWNPGDKIVQSIKSIQDQGYTDYEVIIIDNNSTDGSIEKVANRFGEDRRLRIVRNSKNVGFAAGMNQGINRSRGDYICCYNHDTTFPENYLTTLDDTVSPEAVWTTARISFRVSKEDKVIRLLTGYRFTLPYKANSLSGTIEVNFISGDGIIIPREIYDEIDRDVFDEALPIRGEDVEFSLFLDNRGTPMRAILDTHTIHPDKTDMYELKVENGLRLLRTIHSRISAHKRWGSLRDIGIALVSLITTPLVLHGTQIPRSEEQLSKTTSTENALIEND